MGRQPDTPETQKAKGNPRSGGRETKAVKDRKARFAKVCELLAPVAGGLDVPPPAFLSEPGFEAALAVWRRLAPELKRTNRLPVDSREAFAVYCTNYAEWLEAQIDINDGGRTQRVKTVAGGVMERDRPAMRHRQQAFDNILKMSERFGLTPRDMYSLFKDQAAAAHNNPGLFGEQLPAPKPAEKAPETTAPAGVIGTAKLHKSAPPTFQ